MSVPQAARSQSVLEDAGWALHREELGGAVELYSRAEALGENPDSCAGGRWMAYMLAGDFHRAWAESDSIRERGAPDAHRFWNGESLDGKRLMLRSLHGFGDAVQMLRFVPRLRSVVAELTVEVAPRFVELASCFPGMGRVITWGDGAPAETPRWDVQMEVMELPYALRLGTADLAPTQGYLGVPEAAQERVRSLLTARKRPRVGVVWASGEWNPDRSIPLALWGSLLQSAEVEFWSLQGGPEQAAWTGGHDAAIFGDGLVPLAGAVQQMDLVITVDTLAAHLAGALGVPCWVLLQRTADWRWMSRREDTPWYDSLRLLRQRESGDWTELLQRVERNLQHWVEAWKGKRT